MDTPTTVPELRRLLEAKQDDDARCPDECLTCDRLGGDCGQATTAFHRSLTDDTIAAMLTALEAAEEALSKARPAANYGECIIIHGALGIALAPLFPKEEDDE